jgi:hypothetical protein
MHAFSAAHNAPYSLGPHRRSKNPFAISHQKRTEQAVLILREITENIEICPSSSTFIYRSQLSKKRFFTNPLYS